MSTVQNTVFDCDPNSMDFRCTFDPSAKEVTEEVQLQLVYLYCMIVQYPFGFKCKMVNTQFI